MKSKLIKGLTIIGISLAIYFFIEFLMKNNPTSDIDILFILQILILPFVLPIFSIRKHKDNEKVRKVLTYIVQWIGYTLLFMLIVLGEIGVTANYLETDAEIKFIMAILVFVMILLGVLGLFLIYYSKPFYHKEHVKKETPKPKETINKESKPLANPITKHCEGCNAPITFKMTGIQECEYCGRKMEYKEIKVVQKPVQRTVEKNKTKKIKPVQHQNTNYKTNNKSSRFGIWELIGFLTSLLWLPFIFIDEYNKIQRRKHRRNRRY